MVFDATRLYPSAKWDQNSLFPKIESVFAFKPHTNDVYVGASKYKTFNQEGNEGAILIKIFYNPPDLIFQKIPMKEKVNNIEVDRLRNGNNTDTLTNEDIQETAKVEGKLIQVYEGVIYREIFKLSPFRKLIENLFALRQEYKAVGYDFWQKLFRLIMNSFYGVEIRKDFNEIFNCKSEHWMRKEYDYFVSDYWKIPMGNFIVKFKKDDGLDGDNDVKNTLPCHMGAFISRNSKRNANCYIRQISGFYNISIYYGHTDRLYIEKK